MEPTRSGRFVSGRFFKSPMEILVDSLPSVLYYSRSQPKYAGVIPKQMPSDNGGQSNFATVIESQSFASSAFCRTTFIHTKTMNPTSTLMRFRIPVSPPGPRSTFGVALAAICIAAQAVSAQTLMDFQFNEGTGTTVSSSDGKLLGTFVGAPKFSTDTPSGAAGDYSLQFATGDRVSVPDPNKILNLDQATPNFTIEAWVKFATPAARAVYFYNNGPGGAVSGSVFTDRTVYVTTLGKKDQPSSAKIPDDGAWHHIAVVHENNKEFRFYVDGALGSTVTYTNSVLFGRTNAVFYIGAESTGGLQYTGLLDRLRYSKGALTPDQLDSKAVVTGPQSGTVFFSENFDATDTAGLVAKGWNLGKNDTATETGTEFVVAPPYATATEDDPKEPGGNFTDANGKKLLNPPTADGTESSGKYLISDSDTAGGSDDIGSLAEFWAITPNFSTVGATAAWFHADAEIENNNNGEGVAEIAVSTDDGATCIPIFQTVEPQRPEKALSNLSDVAAGGVRTGGYPEFGSASVTKTWTGVHDRIHLQLPAAALNQPKVRVRIEYFEPADAWWIALDNIVVDSNPPPKGEKTVLTETFANGIPATWKLGNKNGQNWSKEPLKDDSGAFRLKQDDVPINVDIVKEAAARGVAKADILNPDKNTDFAAINPNGGGLDGKWITMLAGGDYALWQEGQTTDEVGTLDTPALDLTAATAVFLDFDSEIVLRNDSATADVYVSPDNGQNWSRIFTYQGALLDRGEAPYFDHHYLTIPAAAGKSGVIFRFQAGGGDPDRHQGFWAIDNVRVTTNEGASTGITASISRSGNSITIQWSPAGGTLETSPTLGPGAVWTPVGTANPVTIPIGTGGFYRIKQ